MRRDTSGNAVSRLSAYRLPLLSGLLIGTSYIPFPPWAILFCYVPLWTFWLRQDSLRRVLWGGWVAQLLVGLIGFHWVAHTAHEFGHLPWPAAILALLLFGALGHLFLVLAGFLWFLLAERPGLSPWTKTVLLPVITALCEWGVPSIFPWNLGYPWLYARLPAFQLAEYVGFQGLGVVTLLLNLLLLMAWERRRNRTGAALVGSVAVLLLVLNAAGWALGRRQDSFDSRFSVLAVQGNVGNVAKEYAERGLGFREAILAEYFRLTRQGLGTFGGEPDFALWPESAFPDTFVPRRMDAGNAGVLRDFLRSNRVALVTGARGYDEASGRKTNAVFLFDREGNPADAPYVKTRLLVFGEHVPLSGRLPALKRWFPYSADFARGPGPEAKRMGRLVLGPQICYEGLFPGFSKALADQGAQVFVNVTNDSWFGTSAEPYQHLYMTLARGIEFRRPVVRATNTGITAAMRADGSLLALSPLNVAWAHLYVVPYRKDPAPTFYQRFGFRLVPASLGLAAGLLAMLGRIGKRRGP